eukprot:g5062.t1
MDWASSRAKTSRYDTEAERRPVKPHLAPQKASEHSHGSYDEIAEEEFLKVVTSSQLCVVHFYHRHFEKCKIMDMHLRLSALMRCDTCDTSDLKAKPTWSKAPFFVEKLAVRTLPCVIVFNDGVAKGRQVGFEGLGGDEFATGQLAWKLKEWEGIEEDFDPDDDF